jgi:hypothetical protein
MMGCRCVYATLYFAVGYGRSAVSCIYLRGVYRIPRVPTVVFNDPFATYVFHGRPSVALKTLGYMDKSKECYGLARPPK